MGVRGPAENPSPTFLQKEIDRLPDQTGVALLSACSRKSEQAGGLLVRYFNSRSRDLIIRKHAYACQPRDRKIGNLWVWPLYVSHSATTIVTSSKVDPVITPVGGREV